MRRQKSYISSVTKLFRLGVISIIKYLSLVLDNIKIYFLLRAHRSPSTLVS